VIEETINNDFTLHKHLRDLLFYQIATHIA